VPIGPSPPGPHDRLGEIAPTASDGPATAVTEIEEKVQTEGARIGADAVVIVYDRIEPVGAYVSRPGWGRSGETTPVAS